MADLETAQVTQARELLANELQRAGLSVEPCMLTSESKVKERDDAAIRAIVAALSAPQPVGEDADLVESLAAEMAAKDGLKWDEQCGYEADAAPAECFSSTCIAALYEEHDPVVARANYRAYSKIAAARLTALLAENERMAARLATFQRFATDLRALIIPGGEDRVMLPSGKYLIGEGATAYLDLVRAIADGADAAALPPQPQTGEG